MSSGEPVSSAGELAVGGWRHFEFQIKSQKSKQKTQNEIMRRQQRAPVTLYGFTRCV